eukprot:15458810-Alexandrium_andersonii.AAC.1
MLVGIPISLVPSALSAEGCLFMTKRPKHRQQRPPAALDFAQSGATSRVSARCTPLRSRAPSE